MFVTFTRLGRFGRLGNQLFQIAATIGTARRNGCDYVLPPWRHADMFQHRLNHSDRIVAEATYRYTTGMAESYRPIDVSVSTDLVGWFQSEKYFAHCEGEIHRLLTPGERLLDAAKEYTRRYFDDRTVPICAINVRRGDYVGNPRYVDLCRTRYYTRAIGEFAVQTRFLVFSDDLAWCRNYFAGPRFTFADIDDPLVALYLMSRCDHHIIANSSFAWWGAWWNPSREKRVIVPDHRVFEQKHGFSVVQGRDDWVPDAWKTIPTV